MGFCIKAVHTPLGGHSVVVRCRVMRLHYYTPAVPQSYCVGVHNGHGFGSLFARIFSKVAAKTAARAAVKVAKVAGRKALKVVTTKGVEVAKKVAKQALEEGAKIGSEFATQKIEQLADKALKAGVSPSVVQSVSTTAKRGVQSAQDKTSVAVQGAHALIDKGASRVEQVAGLRATQVSRKRKARRKRPYPHPASSLQNIIDSA